MTCPNCGTPCKTGRTKKRNSKTPKELLNAAEHVNYEMEMFRHCHRLLHEVCQRMVHASDEARKQFVPVKNALLTSYVIHMRNLYTFCFNRHPQKSDIVAGDYITDFKNRPAPKKLERWYPYMNRLAAHLSFWRKNKTKWPIGGLSPLVASEVWGFLSALEDGDLRARFPELSEHEFWNNQEGLSSPLLVGSPADDVEFAVHISWNVDGVSTESGGSDFFAATTGETDFLGLVAGEDES